MKRGAVQWIFDALPPSGARRGGDPASHVFRQSVRTFVREVVQNAGDQACQDGVPEVHFRFHELAGPELDDFLDALGWTTLEPHLEAAARTRGGRAIKAALDDLRRRNRLLVLAVEDRDTVGLTGDELEGESHFRALCKDTLYSHKQTEGAGGSFGLGKSLLWTFSGFSTVLFNSSLSAHLAGQESPRLIGRAELPTHAVGRSQAGFTGSGWLGRRVEGGGQPRAESVWSEEARQLAARLRLARTVEESTGTSILVLGFRDPTADGERSVDELAREIRDAVEREFWPATIMPHRRLVSWVAVGGQGHRVVPRDFQLAAPFVECYEQRASETPALVAPGDVVVRSIEVDVPARRDRSEPATRGQVRLCVRLFDEESRHELVGNVALFRGPGMVVRYLDRRSLALSARPFHAVLACGAARDPENPLASDHAIERFLRAAEPPGHDDWETTPVLKEEYQRGYAKALETMRRRLDEALKALVVARPRQGRQGPDRLRRHFPLGQRGAGGSGPSAFRFTGLQARFEAGRWSFAGEIRPATSAPRWACQVRLVAVGEDGSEVRAIPIARMRISDSAEFALTDGRATILTTAPSLRFEGESVGERILARSMVTLEVKSTTEA
ncbi:MAG TPA: hypothetical protein VEL05_00565 [Candidatus Acidoferrum sp.]|nr:hypothetical protein [Candidatus Acidoferrum sp.]